MRVGVVGLEFYGVLAAEVSSVPVPSVAVVAGDGEVLGCAVLVGLEMADLGEAAGRRLLIGVDVRVGGHVRIGVGASGTGTGRTRRAAAFRRLRVAGVGELFCGRGVRGCGDGRGWGVGLVV